MIVGSKGEFKVKKVILILTALCLMNNLQAKEWYEEEGTLHQSTMKEWCKADASNKLVTAGDFISLSFKEKLLKPELIKGINKHGLSGLKVMAEEMVTALDKAACNGKKVSKEFSTTKVSDLASMSMMLMGWIGKE